MSAWLFGLWLAALPAAGQTAPPAPSAASDPSLARWVTIDRRARNIYRAGAAVGLTGLALGLTSIPTGSGALATIGDIGTFSGGPIMLAATFRSAQALRSLGGRPRMTWGYIGWSTFAADIVFRVGANIANQQNADTALGLILLAFLAEIGTYTAAVVQQYENNDVRKVLQLRAGVPPRRRPRLRVAVVPQVGRTVGLSLVVVGK